MESKGEASSAPGSCNGNNGRLLLVPYPIHGHITPFMRLSHVLADQGASSTLMIPSSLHSQFETLQRHHRIRVVSVPGGHEIGGESMIGVMSRYVEELLAQKGNGGSNPDEKIKCLVADAVYGWVTEIAAKMGLKCVVLFPSSPGALALIVNIPKLMEAGVITGEGSPTRDEKINLSPNLPPLSTSDLTWRHPKNPSLEKAMFACIFSICRTLKASDYVLCNWFMELDPSIADLVPNTLPIGPLLTSSGNPTGSCCSEDWTCLSWLDNYPPSSVIYLAFGTSSILSQTQLRELALGLELADRPFLWVVRSDQTVDYPDGFSERTAGVGKTVEWAPQEAVLAHPSVACFVTHCGWNSTVEALSTGVPLVCWPYFADQFHNRSCICEAWGTGVWLRPGPDGLVSRHEIRSRIEEVVEDEGVLDNARKWKEAARKSAREGGSSWRNLREFLHKFGSG